MISVHLTKLRRRISISSEEERAIRNCVSETRRVAADQILIRTGQELNSSTLLLEGWIARTKDLPGGERQVTELHVAGDFADLHGFTLKRLDHDLVTLSECTIGVVPHERLLAFAWGSDALDSDVDQLKVHVRHLREKLERNPSAPEYLTTVRGVGYKLDAPHGSFTQP